MYKRVQGAESGDAPEEHVSACSDFGPAFGGGAFFIFDAHGDEGNATCGGDDSFFAAYVDLATVGNGVDYVFHN